MSVFDKIVKVKPTVLNVLVTNNEARDNDIILMLAVWQIQSNSKISDYNYFCNILLNGNLSPPSSIIRCRCKLQEDNPELRGFLYDERRKQEFLARNQLKFEF